MSERQRLPDRRPCTSREVEWNNGNWTITVGWDDSGRIKEIFVTGQKTGAHLGVIVQDACFMLSRLLQRGDCVKDLADSLLLKHLNRPGATDTGDLLPSLLAVAVTTAALIEAEEGDAMRLPSTSLSAL